MGETNGNNYRRKNKSTIENYQKSAAQKNPRMPQNFQEDMDPPEEPNFPQV
jgi:hypothetical protein